MLSDGNEVIERRTEGEWRIEEEKRDYKWKSDKILEKTRVQYRIENNIFL